MHMYRYACTHTHVHICLHAHTQTHTHTHTHTQIYFKEENKVCKSLQLLGNNKVHKHCFHFSSFLFTVAEETEHDFSKLVTENLSELHLGTAPDKLNKVTRHCTQWKISIAPVWCSFLSPACGSWDVDSGVYASFNASLIPLQKIWVALPDYGYSTSGSYLCVQYFHVPRQWYNCQCQGFFTSAQMLTRVIAHRPCRRVCAESWPWEKNPLLHQHIKLLSVVHLAFWPISLPAGLFCSAYQGKTDANRWLRDC